MARNLKRRTLILMTLVMLVVAVGLAFTLLFQLRQRRWPRRQALAALTDFESALRSRSDALLESVVLPRNMKGKSRQEALDFLQNILRDEISEEGIAVLRKKGRFGSLADIFPDRAERWERQFGVRAEDCVAFRAEIGTITTEVVLFRNGQDLRFLRINNVKQLAMCDEE